VGPLENLEINITKVFVSRTLVVSPYFSRPCDHLPIWYNGGRCGQDSKLQSKELYANRLLY